MKKGVKKGEIVSVAMPNTPETVYLFYAINKIGATANMIDVRFKSERIKECLNSVESQKLFVFNDMLQELDKIIDDTQVDTIVSINAIETLPKPIQLMQKRKAKKEGKVFYNSQNINRITSYTEMLKIGEKANHKVESVYDEDIPAALEHSSGTTGTSKIVALPNKTFIAIVNGYSNCPIEINAQDVFLNLIPPFMAYGLIPSIHFPLVRKMKLVLIPKFEEEKFYDQLIQFKPAVTNATKVHWNVVKSKVETLEKRVKHLKKEIAKKEDIIGDKVTGLKDLRRIKKELAKMKKALVKAEEKAKEASFDFLVVGGIGGDAVGAETIQQLNNFLKQHNCKYNLSPGYGMTELGSTAIAWPGGLDYAPSTTGIPFVKNEVMVLDTDTGEELSYDQVGELFISGPSMMKEYLNNEESTRATIVEMFGKRWIKTSDLAHITEEGAVTIDGRIKRLIITDGGNKIFPIVIENIILQHPAVKETCVVGVPDDVRGMVAKAHIVLKEEYLEFENMILSQIVELCKEKIIDQSLPSEYQIDSELPRTPANKVDVKELERRDLEVKKKED